MCNNCFTDIKVFFSYFQTLCQIDIGIFLMGMNHIGDVPDNLMVEEVMYPETESIRLIRDFNILRETVNMLQYASIFSVDIRKAFTKEVHERTREKWPCGDGSEHGQHQ